MATVKDFLNAISFVSNSCELLEIQKSLMTQIESVEWKKREATLLENLDYNEDDYLGYEECWEVEECIITSHLWEETGLTLEEMFRKLDDSLKDRLLTEFGFPNFYPHLWYGSRAFQKLIKESSQTKAKMLLLLEGLGWTIDNLKKLGEIVDIPVIHFGQQRRRKIQSDKEMFQTFLKAHHINVQIKLLMLVSKTVDHHGQVYEVNSNHIIGEVVGVWYWLNENHPESLKGIRVRDIFSYYEDLKKLKIKLEPSYELPVDEVLKKKIGERFEDYSVVFPKESRDLKWWGDQLQHCVGGYGEIIVKGVSIIISLNKGNNPVYTIEVQKSPSGAYEVHQFMGYKNSPAPENLVNKFKRLLS